MSVCLPVDIKNHMSKLDEIFCMFYLWLVSADGEAPSRMVSASACANLPLHHKVRKFSSGTGSTGWFQI